MTWQAGVPERLPGARWHRPSRRSKLFPPPLPDRDVEPFLVLILLPVAIGVLAEAVFRDAKRASLVAAVGSAVAVGIAVQALDRNESWSWVAAALVSPLPVTFAVATVLFWYGRTTARRRTRRRDA